MLGCRNTNMYYKCVRITVQILPLLTVLWTPCESWWQADKLTPGCLPRHCQWGDWQGWEPCKAKCGYEGVQQRKRVQGVRERCGGAPCTGSHVQSRPCKGDCGPTGKACSGVGGICEHERLSCDGNFVPGLCPLTPKYVQCCVPASACTVEKYSNTHIAGADGQAVYVENGFRPWLDKVNQVAKQCQVKVLVTRSFFLIKNPSGKVLTPSCESSHPTGHAIDFNLTRDGETCDATCLLENYRVYSCDMNPFKCFTIGIQDAGLRWGGSWNGTAVPEHLDDNFYFRNKCQHKMYWSRLQAACKHLPVPLIDDYKG